jgi:dCMP deaminase
MNWHSYFMNLAYNISLKSKDKKKVGAILVSSINNRIISTGYNGLPAGINDNIDWTNRELVHSMIIHAEMNCILYSNNKFENSILYCTLSPCKDCIKIIAAAKINKVIYHTKYRDFDLVQNLANTFNIELILFHENL